MDKVSVAHLFGKCFAEALRERVGDNGGYATASTAAELGSQHHIPAEYVERVTDYAAGIGAVEARELADGSTVFSYPKGYEGISRRTLAIDAGRAEDRGDYAISYGSRDDRPRTPTVLFPEATKDTVTAREVEQAPKTTRSGQDECERWYQQANSRRAENARIIAQSKTPERRNYAADPLAAFRERIEAHTERNRRRYSSKEMQTGDENTRRAAVRGKHWTEAARLIHWLYHKPGKAQEIRSLYYERGAHGPEDQERIRQALNELREAGKIRNRRRSGRTVAVLVEGVKPRGYSSYRYSRNGKTAEMVDAHAQEIPDETEDNSPEQSFEPQVMAEMAAAGASYTEAWDS